MKAVVAMSIDEIAKAELKEETTTKAVADLKEKYKALEKAKKIVRNLEREIADYLEELES